MVREPGGEIVEDGRVTSARFMASKSSSAPHCLAKARSSFLVAALFATLCALMYTSLHNSPKLYIGTSKFLENWSLSSGKHRFESVAP